MILSINFGCTRRKAQSETIGIEASAKGGIGVNDVSRKEDPARRMHLAQKVIWDGDYRPGRGVANGFQRSSENPLPDFPFEKGIYHFSWDPNEGKVKKCRSYETTTQSHFPNQPGQPTEACSKCMYSQKTWGYSWWSPFLFLFLVIWLTDDWSVVRLLPHASFCGIREPIF